MNYFDKQFSVGIVIQDSRVWGDNGPKCDNNSIDMYEGWMKYDFTDRLTVKFGRQVLRYDAKGRVLPPDEQCAQAYNHQPAKGQDHENP